MHPEFWLERWQNNQIGFHQAEPNKYLLSFWPQLQIPPHSRVFVPLCGKSFDLLWLCRQGHEVIGVELSEIAVTDFFSETKLEYTVSNRDDFCQYEAKHLTILQGDFFKLNSEHVQDVVAVFDRAALIALPVELRQRYVRHLYTILPAKVKMLLITLEYAQSEMAGPPFSVNEAEVRSLYQNNYEIELLVNEDVLDRHADFFDRGLTGLREKVYILTTKSR